LASPVHRTFTDMRERLTDFSPCLGISVFALLQVLSGHFHRTRDRHWSQSIRPWLSDSRLSVSNDTLFILGSGTSVTTLIQDNFEEIATHDSIGLNHWVAHRFVPSAYSFEIDQANMAGMRALLDSHIERSLELASRPLVLRFPSSHQRMGKIQDFGDVLQQLPQELLPRLFLSLDVNIALSNPDQLPAVYECLLSKHWVRLLHMLNQQTAQRGSVVWATLWGIVCGYRRIVLVGVDLNDDGRYFWEVDQECLATTNDYYLTPRPTVGLHATADPGTALCTTTRILKAIAPVARANFGTEIEVATPNSSLSTFLNRYKFD